MYWTCGKHAHYMYFDYGMKATGYKNIPARRQESLTNHGTAVSKEAL